MSDGSDKEFWREVWNGGNVQERQGRPPVAFVYLLVRTRGGRAVRQGVCREYFGRTLALPLRQVGISEQHADARTCAPPGAGEAPGRDFQFGRSARCLETTTPC